MDFVRFVRNSSERDAWSSLLILFGFICLGFVLASVVQAGLMIAAIVKESGSIDLEALSRGMSSMMGSRTGWWLLVTAQGLSSLILFVLTALAYWRWIERKPIADFSSSQLSSSGVILTVFILQMAFLPFNSYLGSINENVQLPGFLSGLENTLKEMERSAAEITEYLAKSDTLPQLLMNILVIGVIAGIGEELIFRGIVLRKLLRGLNNEHLAIWLSAILFSAIHFQFYGFLPRMMLGAFFGYLYVWTGNIRVPIAAHIFNNTVAVILFHFIHKGVVSPELEKMDNIPLPWVVLSTLVFAALLYRFYYRQKAPQTDA
ncbi:lysostaphin resistance A-like protein [Leadbetterella sp. DM7]|uniref:CPBP family intramembrane glutamic endopeptidase n=1 Tax=Leadbetterella sp. DM7 TaxID=3235085 RepID=UPI00349EEBC4